MNAVKFMGALALATSLASTSLAQAPPGPGPGGPRMMRDGAQLTPEQRQQRRAEMRTRMQERRAERMQLMHDALGVQPNQEAAWKAWQDAMTPPEPPAPPTANTALTTPQRLDQQLAQANERAANVRKRVEATKRFYAQLTPSQQKSFDALQKMQGRGDGDRRGRMMRRMGAG